MRLRRVFRITVISVATFVAVVLIAAVILLQTNFAREKVRGMLEKTIAGMIDGEIRIGAARGGLLGDLTLIDVSIKDSAGQPFIAVDTVRATYDLFQLLKRKFVLGDVLLVNPVVLLDQKTGEQWNYARIFRVQTDTTQADTTANNLLVRLDRVRLVNGEITLRSSWQPDSTLTAAERENAIARALSDSSLLRIERTGNSYQMVQEYRGIYAKLPTVRIIDPGQTTMLIAIDSLSGDTRAFRGDAVTIRQAAGEVEIAHDSIMFRGMHLRLPHSVINAEGTYGLKNRSITARVLSDSLGGSDARRFYSAIPARLQGSFAMEMNVSERESRFNLTQLTARVDDATIQGKLDVTLKGSSVEESTVDANLRVTSMQASLVRELAPAVKLPVNGRFTGTVATRGPLNNSGIDADITFDDRLSGRSRVTLHGVLAMSGRVRLRDMRVQMSPIQMTLARNYLKDFPLEGSVTGSALLNGVVGDSLASVVDLDVVTNGRTSRIDGTLLVLGRQNPALHADLNAEPVDLSLANAFIPDGRLRGQAQGSISLNGPMSALNVGADLVIRNGGSVGLEGVFDFAADTLRYTATITTEQLNLATILEGMQTSSITALSTVQGRGVDPGTMQASLNVMLRPSKLKDAELDSAQFRGSIAEGVLKIDSLGARLDGAVALAHGSLGITDSTTGDATVRVFVDSLKKLSRWIPRDSIKVAPRPSRIAEAYRIARADSARIARETEIQRLIDGTPPPRLNVRVPPVIPRDSLAGSAMFLGRLSGNTKQLTAQGELTGSRLVALGMTTDTANVIMSATFLPAESLTVRAQFRAVHSTALGFALDTVFAGVTWNGREVAVQAEVKQGAEERYEARLIVSRAGDSTVVDLEEARFHFDTATTWQTLHPTRVVISDATIAIDSLDMNIANIGSVHARGSLSRSGVSGRIGGGNIEVAAYGIEVSHILDVLQADLALSGVFSGGMTFTGTLDNPSFKGAAGFVDGVFGTRPMPELHALFDHSGGVLKTELTASRKLGATFARGTAEIPLDLTRPANMLVLDKPIRADIQLDSVPLELVPDVTQQVSQMHGQLRGAVKVAGTMNNPEVNGEFTVVDGSAVINSLGVHLQQIAANVVLEGDTLMIRSFTSHSGGGPVTLEGGLGLVKLSEPSFGLHLVATNAYVLSGERGRLRADVNMTMSGPFLAAAIEGSVDIKNGVVYIPDYSTKTILAPSDSLFLVVVDTTVDRSRQIYQAPNTFMENLVVNVDLTVAHDTWARSADANIELYSDDVVKIGMKRAHRSLTLDGVLSTEQGQYTFLGKRFEIKRGSATFVGTEDEINPNLQITGDHEVQLPGSGTVTISVLIGGTMLRPRITLQSDAQPPLSQSDMLAFLAFGTSSGSLLAIGASTLAPGGGLQGVGRVAAQQLPGIALGVLMDELERAAEGAGMRRLGLDFLNIVPAATYTEIAKGDILSFLRQTSFEAGSYLNTRTYVAGQLRFSATPGIRAVHRADKGYRVEMSWEPRLVLLEPTLSEQRSVTKRAFGLFLLREWRF